MCGILGGNNTGWDYGAGIAHMQHRGPDGIRIVERPGFTLAFARLAIMDLSENGMQPMFSEDGRVGIVYNGEIYGYQGLKAELEKMRFRFRSESDTEVILNAYLAWGDRFIDRIDGMFALAIYDFRDETIKLYRDRAGIKPLYYYCLESDFAFASEMKGIIHLCTDMKLQKDDTAIYDYLNYSYIPEPKTVYKNIFKLEPAHRLVYSLRKKKISVREAYWKLRVSGAEGKRKKADELVEELRNLIRMSVRRHMTADVPVGTFLSGGIDSSIVTYESSLQNPKIETISMGFADRRYDELRYAQSLVDKYGLTMNQRVFQRKDCTMLVGKIREWYDEPFADVSAFPTYLVSSLAKEKVDVVLTGDGGDEVFGGYPRYTMLQEREKNGIDNLLVSGIFQHLNRRRAFTGWETVFMDDLSCLLSSYGEPLSSGDRALRKKLGIPKDYDRFWHMRKYYVKDLPAITRGQYLDFKTYLPGSVLTKVDRASMAVSLETRVPLLDREIIEFAFGLSQEDRCPCGLLKGLLKKAYQEELGRGIAYRKKQGFNMPTDYLGAGDTAREKLLRTVWRDIWREEDM